MAPKEPEQKSQQNASTSNHSSVERSESIQGHNQAKASKAGSKQGFWQRRLIGPITSLLQQGMTPDKLALALSAGAVCGVFPSLGTTSILCLAVGWVFGLNQVALQTANYLVYPLQILLLLPFFQAGTSVFGLEMPVSNVEEVLTMARNDSWQTIVLLWDVSWRAMILWTILAFPAVYLLAMPLRMIMRRLANRRSHSLQKESK